MKQLKLPNPEFVLGWFLVAVCLFVAFTTYSFYVENGGAIRLGLAIGFVVSGIFHFFQAILFPRHLLIEWNDAQLRITKGKQNPIEAPWQSVEAFQDDQISYRLKFPGAQGFRLPLHKLPDDLLTTLKKWDRSDD